MEESERDRATTLHPMMRIQKIVDTEQHIKAEHIVRWMGNFAIEPK